MSVRNSKQEDIAKTIVETIRRQDSSQESSTTTIVEVFKKQDSKHEITTILDVYKRPGSKSSAKEHTKGKDFIPLTYSKTMARYDRVVEGWPPERNRSMHEYIQDDMFKVRPWKFGEADVSSIF